ncbi:MAG: phospholipase D-like domain-containing protein [bacterium]
MIEFPIDHKLFTETLETWGSMLEDIHHATQSIDFEQFYITADEASAKFVDALIERAKNGVKIRCHLDSAGSFSFANSKMYKDMRAAGIEIKFFNWLIPFTKGFHKFGFFRNHRRLLLVDSDTESPIAHHGGICIGKDVEKWADISVRISVGKNSISPIPNIDDIPHPIASMKKSFDELWDRSESLKVSWTNIDVTDLRSSLRKYRTEHQKLVDEKNKLFNPERRLPFTYVTQSPIPGKHNLYRALEKMISNAVEHVTISTPYFLPTHRIMRKLVRARKRGVVVTIIIPEKSDHPIVDIGARTYISYFLEHDISIYRHPRMIHGKAIEIDGKWAMVGTMNLDNISLRYNFESGIISGSESFVLDVEQNLSDLRIQSKIINMETWQKRGLRNKIAELLVWPFRKFL